MRPDPLCEGVTPASIRVVHKPRPPRPSAGSPYAAPDSGAHHAKSVAPATDGGRAAFIQQHPTRQSMRWVHFANGTMYLGHYGKRTDPTRTRKARVASRAQRARRK